MSECKITPYEGHEPYIFVSYSHQNKEQVYRVIEALQNAGFRVWFDEGIRPGDEWNTVIAEHIEKCSAVVPFISRDFVASTFCTREVTFASIDCQKPFISVILDETEIPSGLRMNLSIYQMIQLSQYVTLDGFVNDLRSADAIKTCMGTVESKGVNVFAEAEPKKLESIPVPAIEKKMVSGRELIPFGVLTAILIIYGVVLGLV